MNFVAVFMAGVAIFIIAGLIAGLHILGLRVTRKTNKLHEQELALGKAKAELEIAEREANKQRTAFDNSYQAFRNSQEETVRLRRLLDDTHAVLDQVAQSDATRMSAPDNCLDVTVTEEVWERLRELSQEITELPPTITTITVS